MGEAVVRFRSAVTRGHQGGQSRTHSRVLAGSFDSLIAEALVREFVT